MSDRDAWVLVSRFDELFVGCAVRISCAWCDDGYHVRVLDAFANDIVCRSRSRGLIVCTGFLARPGCDRSPRPGGQSIIVTSEVVAKGRVERLRPDETTAAEDTATSKPRELAEAGR